MANNPSELRLRFLKQAAHLLTVPAPTAAAALGAAHDQLLTADDQDLGAPKKDWDALRREVCGACGNVMVPGWSCQVSHRSRPEDKKAKPSEEPRLRQEDMVYLCLRCDCKTIQPLQTRPPKHIGKSKAGKNRVTSPEPETRELRDDQSKVTKSANATSKQRKKARKGGLQAMLEKNRTQSSGKGGLGLDLMDFMQ
ncbi:hypothetical protein BU26DRAFT_5495 [Trematosphaeria pertusa]|uniref:Rpr2-domain-containing protein n=1 Tax=Trematosphaeria pertusa TaxID=390896 RepID=A0A6A6J0J1_9PLEO|nr:uncharacterized protein BU26DRAFT_5495 [Trematosphaeria pertusa]KAF2255672.1 hypothetical protein BU26DRAFT_5495 [Trematosphaeria pertusa]